jgi:prevent-host-death family protein
MPISEASGHLDEVADESAATGEVIYLTRDGRRLAAIVPAAAAAEIEAAEYHPRRSSSALPTTLVISEPSSSRRWLLPGTRLAQAA